jgi:hypothetical protein
VSTVDAGATAMMNESRYDACAMAESGARGGFIGRAYHDGGAQMDHRKAAR